jgi:hypothetical protein
MCPDSNTFRWSHDFSAHQTRELHRSGAAVALGAGLTRIPLNVHQCIRTISIPP